ncbi:GNAT family N-acetyltransferase [Pseudobdellovibrio sp. HCB154]|uniref:GNAT family N-acetyltransferase n=1 Tax=Pseudobdellovibrio sp. HCB154 TaxID=3386277 RepID=UPI0039172B45
MNFEIKPINLAQTKETCIKFREDSYVVSFGDAKRFYEADGKGADRYIEWLHSKLEKDPGLAVHCFLDGELIGQIELGYLKTDSTCGYVNLFYLIPSVRGKGLGAHLDIYAIDYFKAKNIKRVMLSVSPTNTSAIAFYKKRGWIELGPRPDHPEVHNMEKSI